MKTLPVTQLFVQKNNYRTIASREDDRNALALAQEAFLRSGNRIEMLPTYREKPKPVRRHWIDPESVLRRQRMSKRDQAMESAALPIIKAARLRGVYGVRQALREAGVTIRPKDVDLIAARHSIEIAGPDA